DAQIAGAMMGIGAVKGVEIGDGFASARLKGSEHNDPMDGTGFLSNHAGGILGGISNGNEIVVRIAVKPTASIALPQKTRSVSGDEQTISVKGRHDPCIVPRLMPVAEAMLALVLFDTWLEQEKYRAVIQKNGL
ncbi:MAG TPA: chorismate synthase, partial [Methanoregulaceae archaeon]|nr:chorismate synthase [Methanoregulaceae archaeon]